MTITAILITSPSAGAETSAAERGRRPALEAKAEPQQARARRDSVARRPEMDRATTKACMSALHAALAHSTNLGPGPVELAVEPATLEVVQAS